MISKKFFTRSNSTSSTFSFRRRKKKSIPSHNNESNHHDPPPSPPRLTRRSISPSELHYFSNSSINAPLLPLEYQYESNEMLLELFNVSLQNSNVGLLDNVAYGIGLKYVEVALFTIPRHGYYENAEYRLYKEKSVLEARRVIKLLEGIVQDDDDVEKKRRETVHKLALVAERSYEEVTGDDEGKKCNEVDNNWGEVETVCTSWKEYVLDGTINLCSLLEMLDCGGGLGTVFEEKEDREAETAIAADETDLQTKTLSESAPDVKHLVQEVKDLKLHATTGGAAIEPSLSSDDNRNRIENQHSNATSATLRDEVPFDERNESSHRPQQVHSCDSVLTEKADPAAINNYSADELTLNHNNNSGIIPRIDASTTRQNSDHSYTPDGFDRDELALALSLSKHECSIPKESSKPTTHHDTNISTQTKLYQQRFHSLVDKGKFHVRFLDTYQGRIRGSTNGCTVIAPLTCIQYFITPECNPHSCPEWNAGVPDEHIHQVIDVHAPSVLSSVRGKLNLAPDSFIIPSDVHDHLFEVGLLSPSSFVGVCGGNILDDEHLLQLKNSLLLTHDENESKRLDGKKIASPMFFHGHVVALHVIREGDKVWIELIDSLPNPEAWVSPSCRQKHAINNNDSSYCEGREPDDEHERQELFVNQVEEDALPMNAVRIRCTDLDHFDTLLRYYALGKFSREERKYIEENQWTDQNCHFDPRVFQAFIFSEAE